MAKLTDRVNDQIIQGFGNVTSWNNKTDSGVLQSNDGKLIHFSIDTVHFTQKTTSQTIILNQLVEFKATKVWNSSSESFVWHATLVTGMFPKYISIKI